MAMLLFCTSINRIFSQGGLRKPGHLLVYETFGIGDRNPSTIGHELPPGRTNFNYSTEWCPPQGSYTIARSLSIINGCFNNSWIPLGSDMTGNYNTDHGYGFMMIVNNVNEVRTLFADTIEAEFCATTTYKFSVGVINISKITNCNTAFPRFALVVEPLGQRFTYFDYLSPVLPYANERLEWGAFGGTFQMPGGRQTVRVSVVAYPSSTSNNDCGNDFAIDDIRLEALGPWVNINFAGVQQLEWVMSACYQDNRRIGIEGAALPYYINTAYQWEQSMDGGRTWQDIPGATNQYYERTYSQPDTFFYRLRASEASDINVRTCGVVSNYVKVEINGIPDSITCTSNSPVCSGSDLQFNATGGATYVWNGPNGFSDNISFPHIFQSTLKDSGWYYVTIRSLGGCVTTDSTFVKMIGTDVNANPDTSICLGESARLNVSEAVSYEWTPAQSLSNANSRKPVARPTQTTLYIVETTDKDGCKDTASTIVTVRNIQELIASFTSEDVLCRSTDSAHFTNNSKGVIDTYHWDFGNGNTSIANNPSVQFYQTGSTNSFVVRLVVIDTAGCEAEEMKLIKVAEMCNIEVPTAFSPNNDGLNDFFAPMNAYKANNLRFSIYNRAGQLMYETKEWTKGWNGKRLGLEQPAGVYVWMLEYKDATGKKVFSKGTVLLIR
jgi:gliding motility-associated-like protein